MILSLPPSEILPSVARYIHQRGDTEEFHALDNTPRDNKPGLYDEIYMQVEAMLRIDALIASGTGKVAARRQVAALYRGQPGMRLSSLNIKHGAWSKGGRRGGVWHQARDWRYFLPQYTNGETNPMVRNAEFCQYVAMLCGDTQRDDTDRSVERRLKEEWKAGKAIPGVGTIAEWCASRKPPRAVPARHQELRPEDCPSGWSEWQLRRCAETVLGRRGNARRRYLQRGEHAAMSHWSDQLYRSRANLRPLELVTCDDIEFDIYVTMPTGDGHIQVVRPRGIFMMDVGCACILNWGVTGAYRRQYYSDGGDAGTRRAIQTGDMKELMLATLEMHGLPQNWPMHFLHENATAKLSEHDMELFQRFLPIEFSSTQMMKTRLPGGLMESCGNPKQKGWIESFFHLFSASINHLPGTIGRRYDLTRGDVGTALWRNGRQTADRRDTLIGETIAIIKQAGELARQRGCAISDLIDDGSTDLRLTEGERDASGRFRLPVLSLAQFIELVDQYVQRLNARTKHNLEGFGEVIDIEVRPGEFLPDYHPVARQLLRPGVRHRLRLESPAERLARLSQGQPFTKPTPAQLLVLASETKPITIRNEQVTITPRGHHTPVRFRDAESAEALAAYNGKEKALVYFLSPNLHQVHLFTNDGALNWVASPARIDVPDIMDERAMGKRMGEVHRYREEIRAETAELMAPRAQALDELRAHNAQIPSREGGTAGGGVCSVASAIATAETRAQTDRQRQAADRRALAKVTDDDIDSVLDQPEPAPTLSDIDLEDAF